MMTATRACLALVILSVVGLVAVGLRAERVRLQALTQAEERKTLLLRREMWNIQVESARLRAPQQVRDRVRRLNLPLEAGFEEMMSSAEAPASPPVAHRRP
jgi:hypothetical protein